MSAVLAHVGHWYAEALYVLPVVVVGAWLVLGGRREKRRAARSGERERATSDPAG